MSQQWNPLQDLMLLQDRMNRLFEDATQRRARTDPGDEFEHADWTPAADIYETESGYAIAIDLPGIARDAVEIDVDENRLVIKGNRVIEQSELRAERPRGKFLRSFSIPGSVD
ncbi:MAG TPA: Hsp20/alpha crystallin family protein, partial [Pyrinomonadaceae bacterium]|nr:Hsp20/alpha crystallin family protein [Pyrinomonadaceae bacterium]